MNVCGIICEYNPFHNGHLYHLNEVRKFSDAVVCVMSGNYVQRGEPAVIRKHLRAKAAILNGADLVIELPTPWATASAERFAQGAVSLFSQIPGTTHLSFGCETDDLDALTRVSDILDSNNFTKRLKERLNTGISFASARASAIAEIDTNSAEILNFPNNILAIEYIKALKSVSSRIVPMPVLRKLAAHDSDTITKDFASASAIRSLLRDENNVDVSSLIPDFFIYEQDFKNRFAPTKIEYAERAILAVLKRMNEDDYLAYPDVNEGLHKRIKAAVATSSGFFETVEKIKSKRYAHARIRRILLHIFLGITRDLPVNPPPYLRVLALNDTGRGLVSDCSSIPVITKPASAKNLTGFAKQIFDLEVQATELYSLFMQNPATQMSEWNISPIYIPGTHR